MSRRRDTEGATGRPSRAAAFAALGVFVALWPLAHRGLVERYQIDPWKLGGFAMYAAHHGALLGIFEAKPGGLVLIDETSLSRATMRELRRLRIRRRALGELARPDPVVRRIHAERPELRNLVVVVQRLWIDPETGLVASEKEVQPYVDGIPFEAPGASP